MGMYDEINGEQIKCFYRPLYYYSDFENKLTGTGISHSCGMLRSYKNRSKLPTKTPWYKYPKNFIIADNRIDPNMYFCPNCGEIFYEKIDICDKCNNKIDDRHKILGIIHIIKNERVLSTCYNIDKVSDNIFKDNELVVDYYGNAIGNINSVSDLKNYFLDYTYYLDELYKIQKQYNCYFKNYMEELKGQKDGSRLPNEEEIKRLSKIYEESLKKREKEINSLREKILNKYVSEHNYKYLNVQQFGEYLTCYLDMEKRVKEHHRENDVEQFNYLKEEFVSFLKDNENILDQYFEWNKTIDEEKERIQNIINDI